MTTTTHIITVASDASVPRRGSIASMRWYTGVSRMESTMAQKMVPKNGDRIQPNASDTDTASTRNDARSSVSRFMPLLQCCGGG